MAADRVFHIELGRDFTAHALAIVDVDDTLGLFGQRHIDIQAQCGATWSGEIFHAQQFHAQGVNRWTQQIRDFSRFFAHRLP